MPIPLGNTRLAFLVDLLVLFTLVIFEYQLHIQESRFLQQNHVRIGGDTGTQ